MGPALVAHLLPRLVLLALVVVEADAMTPLPAVSRTLRRLPPTAAGFAFAVAAVGWALAERDAVADLLLGERLAVLRRQPLPGTAFGPAVALVLAPLGLPIAGLGLLWSGDPAVALLWLGLWLVPGGLGARAVLATPLAGIAVLAAAVPVLARPLALVTWAAAVPVGGILALAGARGPRAAPRSFGWRARGPVGALALRDLRVAWREDRPLVRGALAGALLGVPLAAMDAARWDGRGLTTAALVGLALLGPLALAVPAAVARRLGRTFDPPAWPVSALQRAVALALVAGATLAPGWASAAVAAPPIGVGGHLRIASFVAAVAGGAAWWVAARSRPNPGSWPWWLVLCLAAAIGGALPATAVAALALWRATAGLERRRWAA